MLKTLSPVPWGNILGTHKHQPDLSPVCLWHRALASGADRMPALCDAGDPHLLLFKDRLTKTFAGRGTFGVPGVQGAVTSRCPPLFANKDLPRNDASEVSGVALHKLSCTRGRPASF